MDNLNVLLQKYKLIRLENIEAKKALDDKLEKFLEDIAASIHLRVGIKVRYKNDNYYINKISTLDDCLWIELAKPDKKGNHPKRGLKNYTSHENITLGWFDN